MIVVADEGRLSLPACPNCGGSLRWWGHARPRRVRLSGRGSRALTPRRARCRSCRRTHVLLPDWSRPRRADAVEVIGAALPARAHGYSARAIAAEVDRPHATVRGWLRRAEATAEFLRGRALHRLVDLDPHFAPFTARGSLLAEALEAVAAVAHTAAHRLRLPQIPSPWRLAVHLTDGLWLDAQAPAY